MNARVEWCVRAFGRFSRKRAGHERALKEILALEEACQRAGGRELGAIEESQAFLGPQGEGDKVGGLERLARGDTLPVGQGDLTDSRHGRGEMRERRQVARCTHRSL